MNVKIKGIEKLTEEQKLHMFRVNERHKSGSSRKEKFEILKAWVDERGCVCVRLADGDWYHYFADGSWG